ncbi:hypothetical protein ACIG87_02320 [Micromonospora sp. NPDC051925]|uniref:hypothetical protein n=1 Tax=Micromonospora sp. NPDC051925 TaxID=3364288 RepID=UPI0037C936ED
MRHRPIRPGDLLHLTRSASPQFTRPIIVRAIRELVDQHTYDGWVWITAYQLNAAGDAVRHRELFLRRDGLRWLTTMPTTRRDAPSRTRHRTTPATTS